MQQQQCQKTAAKVCRLQEVVRALKDRFKATCKIAEAVLQTVSCKANCMVAAALQGVLPADRDGSSVDSKRCLQ